MKLLHSPIIEAVLDIDCDMPPKFDLTALEGTLRGLLKEKYPKMRKAFLQQHRIETKAEEPPNVSSTQGIQAFQFLNDDERQIAQFRTQGLSFNRLAPYSTLDDYLPEIERLWDLFVKIVSPVKIRAIRVRNVNRIVVPLPDGGIDLDRYFKNAPRAEDDNFILFNFLVQRGAIERPTGFMTNVVLTGQPPEPGKAAFILDISAEWNGKADVTDKTFVLTKIDSLRRLKNRIFENNLTPECLSLYQQQ